MNKCYNELYEYFGQSLNRKKYWVGSFIIVITGYGFIFSLGLLTGWLIWAK